MTCSGDNGECPEPVEAAGLCSGHRQRKKRGRPINTPLKDYGSWGTMFSAWEKFLQVDGFDREAFRRGRELVRIATKRWMAERYELVPKKKGRRGNTVPKPTDS